MNEIQRYADYKLFEYLSNYTRDFIGDNEIKIRLLEKTLELVETYLNEADRKLSSKENFEFLRDSVEQLSNNYEELFPKAELLVKDKGLTPQRDKGLLRITVERKFQESLKPLAVELHELINLYKQSIATEVPERLKEVCELFRLTDIEKDLLTIVMVGELHEEFNRHIFLSDVKNKESFSDRVFNTKSSTYASLQTMHKRVSLCLGMKPALIEEHINEDARLFEMSLLENDNAPVLTSFVMKYLEGVKTEHFLTDIFEMVDLSKTFDIEKSQTSEKDRFILEQILKTSGGSALLFKGKPGTGKTELVKSLAKNSGCPLYILKHARKKKDQRIPPRKLALYLVQQMYADTDAIFLVDECEDLINSRSSMRLFRGYSDDDNMKSYINEYLDENKCKFIFVANYTDDVDSSTLRRFNYILTFDSISNEHRFEMIRSMFEKEEADFLSEEDIKNLSKGTTLNIGHFGTALTTAKKVNLPPEEKKQFFLELVNNHSKEFLKTGINLKKASEKYTLDGLNCDHDLADVTKKIKKCHEMIKESLSDTSLNIMFSGPPGTGKTEYAKYLGQSLGIPFIFKQGSDLKSMYVGETEKNIKRAFLEAQETKSILFIDEIDAFLYPRDNGQRSWEIGQVNEFLTNMENFRGIFICATNSIERMDPASLRRFLFKIKFDYLAPDGVLKFYETFFGGVGKACENALVELQRINGLTPSDFNSVKRKLLLEDEVSDEMVINLLKMEVEYKKFHNKRPVGL